MKKKARFWWWWSGNKDIMFLIIFIITRTCYVLSYGIQFEMVSRKIPLNSRNSCFSCEATAKKGSYEMKEGLLNKKIFHVGFLVKMMSDLII